MPEARSLTLAECRDYLRTVNSRDGRPYEDATINAYIYPAKALDAWMPEKGLDSQHRVEPVLRVDQDRVARPDVRSLLTLVQAHSASTGARRADTGRPREVQYSDHSPSVAPATPATYWNQAGTLREGTPYALLECCRCRSQLTA